MTTQTTATAAQAAGVTTATIRTWCRHGVVTATREAGRWIIDTASLHTRIAIGAELNRSRLARKAAPLADLTPYKDKARAADKVLDLIETGALVPTGRPGQYLTISSDGSDKYLTDTHLLTCTCRSFASRAYCTHMTAAQAIEAARPTRRPAALTLAA